MYLVKFSRLCMARPPEMMIFAEVEFGTIRLRQFLADERRHAGIGRGRRVSTGAEPPSPAAWKVEVRTVMTFLASVDFTVWIALPA